MFDTVQATHAPEPVDIHVGERIRYRRREIRMSQQDLAQSVGVTFQQLQKYENALNRVSASKLHGIAAKLGVPIEYFFEGLETAASDTPPPSHFSVNAREVAAAFDAIPNSKTRRHIHALVTGLANGGDA